MERLQKEREQVAKIRYGYEPHEVSKLEALKRLDKKVRMPAEATAYALGAAGALTLGTGMSLALKSIGASLPSAVGIAIGIAGIAVMVANYFFYRFIMKKRRKKYAAQILALSEEALKG